MHADQLNVGTHAVQHLVSDQFPDWAHLRITALPQSGTDHAIFRIGDELAARFPLQAGDPEIVHAKLQEEARVLDELSVAVSVASPEPVAIGKPGHGYSLSWSVQTWVSGDVATPASIAESEAAAEDITRLIGELRQADTRGRTFNGQGRGGEIPDHDEWMETCFAKSTELLDTATLRSLWVKFRELPHADEDVMSHSDLIPQNILVANNRITGVIDGGMFGPADPALDLVAAWHLFDKERRDTVRDGLGGSDVEWQRGAAWAFQQAMGLVWYYETSNPIMANLGRSTLFRITEDPELFT